jgi:hypothetical protein
MASKIIRFSYETLRNEPHVAYHESVTALFGTFTPASLNIQSRYDTYFAAYEKEVSALDIIRRSELTAEIEEQDRRRDAVYRGFVDTVKGATKHFDAAKRSAALKILNVIEHYGNIAAKTLYAETAAIDDIARELETGYATSLQTLGLEDWLAQLTAENTAFKTLVADRYAETAARPDVQMKAARKEVDAAFRALLNQVDALVLVNGSANYDAFIAALNAISERYKNILAQEAGMRKKEKGSIAENPVKE